MTVIFKHAVIRTIIEPLPWAQRTDGDCGNTLWGHFYQPLFGVGGLSCAQGRIPPPTVACWVIEWPTGSHVMITLSTQHARSGISQVIVPLPGGLHPADPERQTCLENAELLWICPSHAALSAHLLGFGKHSYLPPPPQDPCRLKYTPTICGPWPQVTYLALQFNERHIYIPRMVWLQLKCNDESSFHLLCAHNS